MSSYKHPAKTRLVRNHIVSSLRAVAASKHWAKMLLVRNQVARRFRTGSVRLVTAQFNRRNAICLVALSAPALLVTGLLTLPAFLFPTPQHNEYFEFARQLNEGGDRWVALGLSACCSFFCFAIPCEDCGVDGECAE